MGSSFFTQINADWIRSPNYNQSATWLEDYMVRAPPPRPPPRPPSRRTRACRR